MQFFWQKAGQQKKDLIQGKDVLTYYKKLSEQLLKQKDDRSRRQAELWAVGNLSDSLTSEYKEVSAQIAYTIKQDMAIKQFIQDLDVELYHCQYGQCEVLEKMIKMNPLADIDATVPIVDYAKSTVK